MATVALEFPSVAMASRELHTGLARSGRSGRRSCGEDQARDDQVVLNGAGAHGIPLCFVPASEHQVSPPISVKPGVGQVRDNRPT